MDELLQINRKGVMQNYPVDATTVEDAINFVETGDGLRTTNISMTDIYAIMEVMKHKENEKPKDEPVRKTKKKAKKNRD
jgi:hypothetical protein